LAALDDPRAKSFLLEALSKHDLEVVAGAYDFFIPRLDPVVVDELIDAFDKFGEAGMAQAFLNSGNQKLHKAGYEWTRAHGYDIKEVYR
jgi:hypothetical protein